MSVKFILSLKMTEKRRKRTDLLVHRYTVRVDEATHNWIETQAKASGFPSGHEFIRELVKRERSGTTDVFRGLEQRIAATLIAQSAEIERTQGTSYAAFAAVMGLAQVIFQTFVPPTREAKAVIDANLKNRMNKFLKDVGIGMKGTYADALQDFLESEDGGEDDEG